MQLRFYILFIAYLFGAFSSISAQQLSSNTKVKLTLGTHPPIALVNELNEQGVSINYASTALTISPIKISKELMTLGEILPKLFDPELYDLLYKSKKVIVRRKRDKSAVKNIMGYIQEQISGERLIGAYVYIPTLKIGTSTNAYGYFSLTLNKVDSFEVVVSYLGYKSFAQRMYPKTENYVVELVPESEELATVEVTSKQKFTEVTQMSTAQFDAKFTERTPAFFGEPDVLRTVQTLPGVQGGLEATTGMFVRGGGADQNLLLLDGVPVYNASHLFGVFSVFNSAAIKNINLIKGGFPARYGGRLSSVINIDMKEGNLQEYHVNGSVGIISSRLTVEGPILKEKMSFMFSGRRTYLDLLAAGIQQIATGETSFNYYFSDVNAKMNYIINPKNRLYASFYTGDDVLSVGGSLVGTNEDQIRTGWGNNTFALRWNHLFNEHLFSNFTSTYSTYKFSAETRISDVLSEGSDFDYESSIADVGFKYDFEYQKFTKHKIRFGTNYTHHLSTPSTIVETEELNVNNARAIDANDLYFYVEDEWSVTKRLKINAGLNQALFAVQNSVYSYLQPRASARYLLANDWSIKASYASMAQFIHLLTNEGAGLPTDLWVTSTDRIAPQLSQQIAIGVFNQFNKGTWEASVEGYYKEMSNLITYKDGASFIGVADWQDAIETNGHGWAYGAEFFLKKLEGSTTGWVSYTLSKSERQFENLNGGARFPFKFDRRHNFNLVLNHQFSNRFDIGLNWVFATGQAFSLPTNTYFLLNPVTQQPELYVDYSERNRFRYPNYHRLDLSMNFRKKTSWGQRTWSISVYNVYNRQNPFYVGISIINNEVVAEQTSLFPILPSISYAFEF
jgi:outer membrane receptor for ferrienterochelin and colicin